MKPHEKFQAGHADAGAIGDPGPARGLIQPVARSPELVHGRALPPDDLSDLVRHYWWVVWDLPSPREQNNLSHPAVHLTFQDGRAEVFGVPTRRFTVKLRDCGRVFGVKFQPGGFSAVLKRPVAALTDRALPAEAIFGRGILLLNEALKNAPDMNDSMELTSRYLRSLHAVVDDDARLASRLVLRLEHEKDLRRVEDLCDDEGLSVRKVQRLFRRFVGVSPKWVICRFRLHEALERLDRRRQIETGRIEPGRMDWVSFALDLGYYDQAHFIKDFVGMVGCAPDEYERRAEEAMEPARSFPNQDPS